MVMRRVYYVGFEPAVDRRLGLECYPGYAFDCPEHIAKALVRELCYSLNRGAPLMDAKPGDEITWYIAPAGEELLALDGVGPSRAARLVAAGVSYLDDLLELDSGQQAALADSLPGVSGEQVAAWIEQARKIKEAM